MEGNYSSISSILGNASMLFWMTAQLPQLYKNFQSGSVKSLSKTFLLVWLLGDFLNLVGSILTSQQPFQIRLAEYFVSVDIIMLLQYYLLSDSPVSTPLLKSSSSLLLFIPSASSLSVNQYSSIEYKIGQILSWICAILYSSSRIPQILLNYKRKSCSGLSLSMFMFAFMGNLTYATSLLLSSNDIFGSLPFLVGSLGTLCQDLFILFQSYQYSSAQVEIVDSFDDVQDL